MRTTASCSALRVGRPRWRSDIEEGFKQICERAGIGAD